MPYPVYLIFQVAAGLMGGLMVAYGAIGLWRTVQPQLLTTSQRLLVLPVSLLTLVLGAMMVLMSVDQEDVAKMLALPLFGALGLTLTFSGPWMLLRSETPFHIRVAALIAFPFGVWMLLGTAAAIIAP